MPRRTPPDRVRDVARAACRVFTEKGYRRTLMTDVGAELALSHALLYRYVESKEALFELALSYAINPEAAAPRELPIPTPPAGRTLQLLKQWAKRSAAFPALTSALARSEVDDVAAELGAIIDERYVFVEHNRELLALIERSALDLPELRALYEKGRRLHVRRLAEYLERRISSGALRPVPDVDVAARFIVESIAWFAWHRRADSDSATVEDEQSRRTARELLVAAFLPEGSHSRAASAGRRRDRAGWRRERV